MTRKCRNRTIFSRFRSLPKPGINSISSAAYPEKNLTNPWIRASSSYTGILMGKPVKGNARDEVKSSEKYSHIIPIDTNLKRDKKNQRHHTRNPSVIKVLLTRRTFLVRGPMMSGAGTIDSAAYGGKFDGPYHMMTLPG